MFNTVTVSTFAKLVDLTQGRISQLVAEGLSVDDHGKIDPEAGQAWITDNLDPARRQRRKKAAVRAAESRTPAGAGKAASGHFCSPADSQKDRASPGGPDQVTEGKLGAIARLRAPKLSREAQLLDIELRRANGTLIEKAMVERVVFTRARMERDQWLGWAQRTASEIAAATGTDPASIYAVLDRAVRAHIKDLSKTPLKLL